MISNRENIYNGAFNLSCWWTVSCLYYNVEYGCLFCHKTPILHN